MNGSRETDRLPQPYTPTPDGVERRLRAWVRLPEGNVTIPGAVGASASPDEPGVRDHAGRIVPGQKGHRRRRGRADS